MNNMWNKHLMVAASAKLGSNSFFKSRDEKNIKTELKVWHPAFTVTINKCWCVTRQMLGHEKNAAEKF